MKSLQILTANNFGSDFWKKNTEWTNPIEFNPLNISAFQKLISAGNEFILIDFYFSELSSLEEKKLMTQFQNHIKQASGFLELFIMSPYYAGSELKSVQVEEKFITSHNYTSYFLRKLSATARKIAYINQ